MADAGGSSVSARRMWCWVPERVQLHLVMLALQFGYAGFHVISRAALNMGIGKLVYLIYRNIIALLLLAPFAYFLEKKERPALTLSLAVQFFFIALVGLTANQAFYLLGLENTSPTFASAIQNSVPAITFLMAAILGIEKVKINRKDGIAKVIGTICCVAGASVITLFKGPTIYTPTRRLNDDGTPRSSSPMFLSLGDAKGKNWTLGCLFLVGHCLSWSGWLVLQAPLLKKYPARLSFISYTCFFGLMQFLIIAAFSERDATAWIFKTSPEILSILYAGVVASGIAYAVQIWCIDRGGPVFVAVYQPVQTLIVAIMATFALSEVFYLGGIIGAALIVVGLYLVLWGKKEERKLSSKEVVAVQSPAETHDKTSLTQPLLPTSTENV